MPFIVLYFAENTHLAVLSAETEAEMLLNFQDLPDTPIPETVTEAKVWLRDQPFPSGWYASPEEARSWVRQAERQDPMAADELVSIRAALNEPRAQFAANIGFRGSPNTRHKQIWEMERARKPILPERARAARALLALRHLNDL